LIHVKLFRVFPVLLEIEEVRCVGASVSSMWVMLWVHAAIMTHVYSVPYKWVRVSSAPSDADLEVCVMDNHGIHALVFPCRKNGTEWVDASTKKHVDIQPTHWRKWTENH